MNEVEWRKLYKKQELSHWNSIVFLLAGLI